MNLSFTPTKLAGGVTIRGDAATLRKAERLLTRTAIESHACDDNGMCMTLSRYFEKNGDKVDWVTLVAGIAALRHSLGYRLSKENHSIVCTLEFLLFDALCKKLDNPPEDIELVLDSLYGLSDRFNGPLIESRMAYLYLLQSSEKRKAELLQIIRSLTTQGNILNKEYSYRFDGIDRMSLCYPAGTDFKYEL